MDGPRDQFLAGAAFAGDQHVGRGGRGLANGVKHLPHRRRPADQAVTGRRRVLRCAGLLAAGVELGQRPAHRGVQFLVGKGLGQVLLGADLDRRHGSFNGRVAGDHDHFGVGQVLPHVPDQLQAIGLGHLEVGDDQIDGSVLQDRQSLGYSGRREDRVALGTQVPLQDLDRVRHVVHDQDRLAFRRR